MAMTFPPQLRVSLAQGGSRFVNMTAPDLQARGVPDDAILAAAKAQLQDGVDQAAEALRLKLITPGAGQAMEYQEALAQSVAALAAPQAATPALYPMLAATVGLDVDPITKAPAADVLGVARSVLAAQAGWAAAGAAIRGARLQAKAAIKAATTYEGAAAAAAAAAWPTLG